MKSAITCDHANEVPYKCSCINGCYCKDNTCNSISANPEYEKPRKYYLITHLKDMRRRILESGRSAYDAEVLKEVIAILKTNS